MTDKNLFLKDYSFYGKHCDMVNALIAKIDEDSGANIFSIVIDLFIMSSLVGVINNHKSKPDSDKSRDKKILAGQFNSHSHDIKTAFKFVTLLGNKEKYDEVTRLNKTFRNPETDENYQAFEEYMLGGLEDIYNKFILDSNKNYSDYLTSMNQFLCEFKPTEEEDDDVIPDAEDLF